MKITYFQGKPKVKKNFCSIVFSDPERNILNKSGKEAKEALARVSDGELGTEFGCMAYLRQNEKSYLFYNLGRKKSSAKKLRIATAKAWKFLRAKKIDKIAISCRELSKGKVRALVEGVCLSDYQFTPYKTKKEKLPVHLTELCLNVDIKKVSKAEIARWHEIAKGVYLARDLMLTPANDLYPETLAKKAEALGKEGRFKVSLLKQKDLEREKMGALLSVSQGSEKEPRLIVMDYKPKNARKTIVLVGKAVTFDSGGLSLKPSSAMPEMKGDMGGGATVFGIMSVLKAIQCPLRVVGLVPAVENMPSGSATRPSDVVYSRSGLTIEINNTDAEGRLILADALDYAKQYKPDYVIDYATLTGACLVALGPKISGIMGNCQELIDLLVKKGAELDDPLWQLPLEEDYEEFLRSTVADVSNISSTRWGGTITAGLFLQRFAGSFQWAHCDLAASITEKESALSPKGGSGACVRATIEAFDELK
ncbi:MAG: leucyl aminopeptidase [Acidobacteria bacterium]|nr:MAG: leucyl aminopeptidase [Acidobacteriota bacterium]